MSSKAPSASEVVGILGRPLPRVDWPTEVTVRVRGDKAVVRKVVRGDEGLVVAKYGLNQTGEWVQVPEGQRYPEECRLPLWVYQEEEL